MNEKLSTAKALYEQGNYLDAIEMCKDALILNQPKLERKEIHLLAAKCMLSAGIESVNDTAGMDSACQSINMACENVESVEELWEIETEIYEAFYAWKVAEAERQYDNLVADPDSMKTIACIQLPVDFIKLSMKLETPLISSSLIDAFCKEKNIDRKTYTAEYRPKPSALPSDDKILEIQYNAAMRMFRAVCAIIPTRPAFSAEYLSNVAGKAFHIFPISETLIKSSYISEQLPGYVRAARMKGHIDILVYKYKTRVSVEGRQSIYLYGNNREELKAECLQIAQKVAELDPGYQMPPLSNTQTSGGCYVATAVYGSYDCPEVWTLRRYRDNSLAKTWYGRAFIRTYYAISPTLVKWFGKTDWFKNLWKSKLDRLVSNLKDEGVEDTPYEDRPW